MISDPITKEEHDIDGPSKFQWPASAEARIAALRRIVATHSFAVVDDVIIDVQSANLIISLFDRLPPDGQAKYAVWPAGKMGAFAWKHATGGR